MNEAQKSFNAWERARLEGMIYSLYLQGILTLDVWQKISEALLSNDRYVSSLEQNMLELKELRKALRQTPTNTTEGVTNA
jgi:hypothetical protein